MDFLPYLQQMITEENKEAMMEKMWAICLWLIPIFHLNNKKFQ